MSAAPPPVACVIGTPIAHSRSPRLHNHWLQRYGIDGHYVALEVSTANFTAAMKALPLLGFKGANVTLPHKELALQLADSVSDRAALIGAANTLVVRKSGKIHADNTDAYGFIANLQQHAPDWKAAGGPAMVLGAGGASRAVIHALIDARAPRILVANRTRSRAEMLREHFGAKVEVIDWNAAPAAMADAATVINTTTLGMEGKSEFKVSLDRINPAALATDIVYTPLQTGFLKAAAARGCTIVDGLGMLLHQGVPGFEAWFGKKPVVDAATRQAVLG